MPKSAPDLLAALRESIRMARDLQPGDGNPTTEVRPDPEHLTRAPHLSPSDEDYYADRAIGRQP